MPAYVVSVNEMAVPILESDIIEEGQTESIKKAYFSMGSYMDKYDAPNCYTLISINETSFAEKEEEKPVTPPADSGNNNGGENLGSSEVEASGCNKGCGSVISVVPALSLLAVLGFTVFFKKKED